MSIDSLYPQNYPQFKELIEQREWRTATILQLAKDFNMAGIIEPQLNSQMSLKQLIDQLSLAIKDLKENPSLFKNLNYRIDLPSISGFEELEPEELAPLYLFRSFQKVYMRKTFSNSAAKDDEDSGQKQLKH